MQDVRGRVRSAQVLLRRASPAIEEGQGRLEAEGAELALEAGTEGRTGGLNGHTQKGNRSMNANITTLARIAYEAYDKAGPNPGKTFDGRPMPTWDELAT